MPNSSPRSKNARSRPAELNPMKTYRFISNATSLIHDDFAIRRSVIPIRGSGKNIHENLDPRSLVLPGSAPLCEHSRSFEPFAGAPRHPICAK
jgi:hypothetical protein